jgi:hypothetical protein
MNVGSILMTSKEVNELLSAALNQAWQEASSGVVFD